MFLKNKKNTSHSTLQIQAPSTSADGHKINSGRRKKNSHGSSITPRYYEFDALKKSVSRKIWAGMGFMMLVTVFSLFLALVAAARPIPVVVYDNGKPILFTDTTTPRHELTDLRIEYFTKVFLKKFICVDSARLEEDLQTALNMMTPVFRKVVFEDSTEMSNRKKYKNQNIKSFITEFSIRIGNYDQTDLNAKIHSLATGKINFEPRFGQLEGEGEVFRYFVSQIALQRVPVTLLSIHGLQLDFVYSKMFDDKSELEKYIVSQARKQ